MMAWGETFDLGDVFSNVARMRTMQMLQQQMEEKSALADQERQQKALELQQKRQQEAFVIKKAMAGDIVRRARAEGLEGDAFNARLTELLPAYAKAYAPMGDLGDIDPESMLALAGPDQLAEKTRETYGLEMARQRAQHAFDKPDLTPEQRAQEAYLVAQAQGRARSEFEQTPEEKLQADIALKAAPSYGDLHAQNKPLTYEQGRASSFQNRMIEANKVVEALQQSGYSPGIGYGLAQKAGGINEALGRSRYASQGPEGQKWAQAEDEWVNALLRSDTGAAYKDMEVDDLKAQFFPRHGESEDLIRQKAKARADVISGFGAMAGGRAQMERAPSGLPPGYTLLPDGKMQGPDGRIWRRRVQ